MWLKLPALLLCAQKTWRAPGISVPVCKLWATQSPDLEEERGDWARQQGEVGNYITSLSSNGKKQTLLLHTFSSSDFFVSVQATDIYLKLKNLNFWMLASPPPSTFVSNQQSCLAGFTSSHQFHFKSPLIYIQAGSRFFHPPMFSTFFQPLKNGCPISNVSADSQCSLLTGWWFRWATHLFPHIFCGYSVDDRIQTLYPKPICPWTRVLFCWCFSEYPVLQNSFWIELVWMEYKCFDVASQSSVLNWAPVADSYCLSVPCGSSRVLCICGSFLPQGWGSPCWWALFHLSSIVSYKCLHTNTWEAAPFHQRQMAADL